MNSEVVADEEDTTLLSINKPDVLKQLGEVEIRAILKNPQCIKFPEDVDIMNDVRAEIIAAGVKNDSLLTGMDFQIDNKCLLKDKTILNEWRLDMFNKIQERKKESE